MKPSEREAGSVVLSLLALIGFLVFLSMLPELRRYFRIRAM